MIRCAMKMSLVAALTLPQAHGTVYRGVAASYSRGTMEMVSRNRGMHADCMVAHTFERLGTWVVVRGLRLGRQLTCLVIDVPQPRDRARIIRRGIIVELAYEDNGYICGFQNEPPRKCPVQTTEVMP